MAFCRAFSVTDEQSTLPVRSVSSQLNAPCSVVGPLMREQAHADFCSDEPQLSGLDNSATFAAQDRLSDWHKAGFAPRARGARWRQRPVSRLPKLGFKRCVSGKTPDSALGCCALGRLSVAPKWQSRRVQTWAVSGSWVLLPSDRF